MHYLSKRFVSNSKTLHLPTGGEDKRANAAAEIEQQKILFYFVYRNRLTITKGCKVTLLAA